MKRPRQLDKVHDVNAFDCGEEALNNFLKENAWQSQLRQIAFTFVVLEENNVIAYYSLSVAVFKHEQSLDRVVKELGTSSTPVLQISRLAVDRKKQGQHLGKHILQDALSRACTIAQEVGIRCLIANAMTEKARKFYQQFHFEAVPLDSFRLYLPMKDVRKTVEQNI